MRKVGNTVSTFNFGKELSENKDPISWDTALTIIHYFKYFCTFPPTTAGIAQLVRACGC